MLTFSSICDKFVIANGLVKDPCDSDDEAKRKAAALGWDDNKYPTVYFGSDTTGEKAYEEFYVPGEKVDIQRFKALGVVCQTTRHEMDEVNGFFEKLEGIFAKEDFTKAQVVEAIKEFIPNFEHEEKGKNLDQKMQVLRWVIGREHPSDEVCFVFVEKVLSSTDNNDGSLCNEEGVDGFVGSLLVMCPGIRQLLAN